MPKLRLSDGTEYACDWCAYADKSLIFNLPEASGFSELAAILDDPMKTRCIAFVASSETTYCGYTRIKYMMRDGWPTGGILVTLEQEE
jgi:hypothetical protein